MTTRHGVLSALFTIHCSLFTALAQTEISWDIETSKNVSVPRDIRRGENLVLLPRFLSYGIVTQLTNAASVEMWYRSSDMSNGLYYVATGGVHSATGGTARIPWTSANCATATNYSYDIVVRTNSVVSNLRGFGTIRLLDGVFSQATTLTNPTLYSYFATNAGAPGAGYYAMSNGTWTTIVPGAGGGTDGAVVTQIVQGIAASGTYYYATSAGNATNLGGVAASSFVTNNQPYVTIGNGIEFRDESIVFGGATMFRFTGNGVCGGDLVEAFALWDGYFLDELLNNIFRLEAGNLEVVGGLYAYGGGNVLTNGQTGVLIEGTLTPTNSLTVTNALQLAGIAAASYVTNRATNIVLTGTLTPTNSLTVTNALQLAGIAAASYVTNRATNIVLTGTLTPTNSLTVTNALQLAGIAAASYVTNRATNIVLTGTLTPTNSLTVTNALELGGVASANWISNNNAAAVVLGGNLTVTGTILGNNLRPRTSGEIINVIKWSDQSTVGAFDLSRSNFYMLASVTTDVLGCRAFTSDGTNAVRAAQNTATLPSGSGTQMLEAIGFTFDGGGGLCETGKVALGKTLPYGFAISNWTVRSTATNVYAQFTLETNGVCVVCPSGNYPTLGIGTTSRSNALMSSWAITNIPPDVELDAVLLACTNATQLELTISGVRYGP